MNRTKTETRAVRERKSARQGPKRVHAAEHGRPKRKRGTERGTTRQRYFARYLSSTSGQKGIPEGCLPKNVMQITRIVPFRSLVPFGASGLLRTSANFVCPDREDFHVIHTCTGLSCPGRWCEQSRARTGRSGRLPYPKRAG